jgi:glyoxylase-like metal-dependent hydrolase (beta-lactamase superfamily II)
MQDVSPVEAVDLGMEALAPQQLGPGAWRIPVPLPFATHSTNVYLLRGDGTAGSDSAGDGWCLVDAPLGSARSEMAFQAGLDAAGISPQAIRAIVLTHGHPDHLGAVGRWQRRTGAPVYLLGLEAQMINRVWADPSNGAMLEAARALARHGMPGDEAQRLATQTAQLRAALEPPGQVTRLAHDQHVHLAGGRYRVLWTPGHADGHLCLLRDDGLLVAGDLVFARMTPTIGWYPWSRPDPLADHDDSLAAVSGLPVRLVLPGHGQPFTDLRARASELRGVHARQTAQVARLLAEMPEGANAYTLAQRLYADRWRWPDARRLAVAETVAHLEHLRILRRVERVTGSDSSVTYRRLVETRSPSFQAQNPSDEPPARASA